MTTLISRSELLDVLKLVEPALGPGSAVPQFSRLWFDGECVSAYNDDIGICHTLRTEFKGGVDGQVLLKLLSSSTAKDVELLHDGAVLSMRMARARPKLAIDDIAHACWSLPEHSKAILPVDTEELVSGIQHCMRSVGSQPSIPESMGVTFEAKKGKLVLYSTTNTALSRAEVATKGTAPFDRLTIHRRFCELLVSLGGKHKLSIELNDQHALATSKSFGIFGRLMATDRPMDFEHEAEKHLTGLGDGTPIQRVALERMLDRALILCTNERVELSVDDNGRGPILTIKAESSAGSMKDSIPFKHPTVKVQVNPNDIKVGCDLDKISIGLNGIVMQSKGRLYLISTM